MSQSNDPPLLHPSSDSSADGGPRPPLRPPSGPQLPRNWGTEPDVGVSSSFLRARAEDCEQAFQSLKKARGPAEEAFEDLARAARGWSFVDGLDQLKERWETLHLTIENRFGHAEECFRNSADAFDGIEKEIMGGFSRIRP